MGLKFLLREDMPRGFRDNPNYPELPAAVNFLKQYENREFKTKSDFEKELNKFPDYLKKNKVPEGSDKRLRSGLLIETTEDIEGVFNVLTKSDSPAGSCWFGSVGSEENLRKYFQYQKDAKTAAIIENDDDLF